VDQVSTPWHPTSVSNFRKRTAVEKMSFLNKIKRGHAVAIDHDLSNGMSRDIFALDEVNTLPPCFSRLTHMYSSRITEFMVLLLLLPTTPFKASSQSVLLPPRNGLLTLCRYSIRASLRLWPVSRSSQLCPRNTQRRRQVHTLTRSPSRCHRLEI
jgi:hypothetical protein